MFLWPAKLAFRIILIVVAAIILYFAVTFVQVWLTSRAYDAHSADAIVVMGAAQYNGVPSPDLKARLDEALSLFRAGDAKLVMLTGGKKPADVYTEAQAGARYLESQGVPAADVFEAGGDDSYENISEAVSTLRSHGVTTVLVATDPFHEDRSMAILSSFGFSPSPTPTRDSPIKGWSTVPYFFKEAVGVGFGRIIGFGHLEWLHDA
jgi:uncharacterized SAM-binding protein YcdF (DUF218 family)